MAVALAMYAGVSSFLERKGSYVKNADFYAAKEDFDVLFLGTSHMIMAISPMELWEEYGITSYNLANYGQWLPVDYWVLKNALDDTTPKVVVVDTYAVGMNDKYSPDHVSQLHEAFDAMPLRPNKVRAMFDLLPKDKYMEYLYPFSLYHTRWNEIDETFWNNTPSVEKGANLDNYNNMNYAVVQPVEAPVWLDENAANTEETVGKEYLRRIIALCEERGIEVLLTAVPFAATAEEQMNLNSVQMIAEEFGVNYYNMTTPEFVLNYDADFYDAGHLNSSGTRKTTTWMGQYLKENYDVLTPHDTKIRDIWDADYEEYMAFKTEWIKAQVNLNSYLMLLCDRKYDCVVEINDPVIYTNPWYVHLLENLSVPLDCMVEHPRYLSITAGGNSTAVSNEFPSDWPAQDDAAVSVRVFFRQTGSGELLEAAEFAYDANSQVAIKTTALTQ